MNYDTRAQVIGEAATRLLGAVFFGERYMSFCGCAFKHWYCKGRHVWAVPLLNRLFRDDDHCFKSFVKSARLQATLKRTKP